MIVVAAVAFLAVAQQQLRGGGETYHIPFFHFQHDEGSGLGPDEADFEGETLGEEGRGDGWVGSTGTSDDHFFGLVGLSLTYALPIVGGCGQKLISWLSKP